MRALGGRFAEATAREGGTIFLYGALGAGKTAFVRGFLRPLGYEGPVRSPTFTLVESYTLGALRIHHLDLYRLAGREELEYLGVRDLIDEAALCLIEWPERGAEEWIHPDIVIRIGMKGSARELRVEAPTPWGRSVVGRLKIGRPRPVSSK